MNVGLEEAVVASFYFSRAHNLAVLRQVGLADCRDPGPPGTVNPEPARVGRFGGAQIRFSEPTAA